jgi:hypothetical protein
MNKLHIVILLIALSAISGSASNRRMAVPGHHSPSIGLLVTTAAAEPAQSHRALTDRHSYGLGRVCENDPALGGLEAPEERAP